MNDGQNQREAVQNVFRKVAGRIVQWLKIKRKWNFKFQDKWSGSGSKEQERHSSQLWTPWYMGMGDKNHSKWRTEKELRSFKGSYRALELYGKHHHVWHRAKNTTGFEQILGF